MANIKRTKEDVINELISLHEKGHPLTSTTVDRNLVRSTQTYFGKWKNAISELGLEQVRKSYRHTDLRKESLEQRTKWSDEIIKTELKNALNKGYTPKDLRDENKNICDAIDRKYGGVNKACDYFGIARLNPGHDTIYKLKGYEFERLVELLLNELRIEHQKQPKIENCIPDFVANNGRWFDAKLSEWSINTCNTIQKYEPNCRLLTIVFLRGNSTDYMVTNKTRLINAYKLVKQLPRDARNYFYTEFNRIENELFFFENKKEAA